MDSYRKLLYDLSSSLNRDRDSNLEALIFACFGKLTGREQEVIVSKAEPFLELWKTLEQQELFGPDKLTYLKRILSDAFERRRDLINLIEIYEKSQAPTANRGSEDCSREEDSGPDLREEFQFVSDNVGRSWRSLARSLELTENQIECIAEDHHRSLHEQGRQTLNSWKKINKADANKEALIAALKGCHLNDLAHRLEQNKYS